MLGSFMVPPAWTFDKVIRSYLSDSLVDPSLFIKKRFIKE